MEGLVLVVVVVVGSCRHDGEIKGGIGVSGVPHGSKYETEKKIKVGKDWDALRLTGDVSASDCLDLGSCK